MCRASVASVQPSRSLDNTDIRSTPTIASPRPLSGPHRRAWRHPLDPFLTSPLGRCLTRQSEALYPGQTHVPDTADLPTPNHDPEPCEASQAMYERASPECSPNLQLWNGRSHELIIKLKDEDEAGPWSNRWPTTAP